jgi:hypothetical protein
LRSFNGNFAQILIVAFPFWEGGSLTDGTSVAVNEADASVLRRGRRWLCRQFKGESSMQTATQKERLAENSATGTAAVREFVTKTVHAAETQLENLGQEAARIKTSVASAVTDAVEDGRHRARKAIKRARVQTEDLID